jgi:hypothetical protein
LRGVSPSIEVGVEDAPALEKKVKLDLFNNLHVLEEHMANRTYIVGERLSVADVCLFAVYRTILDLGAIDATTLPSLYRWYMTVGSIPAVKRVVGEASSVSPMLAVVKPAMGNAQGKWDRRRTRVKELLAQGEEAIGKQVALKGWIRTTRTADKGALLFVELTDGSSVRGMQLVLNATTTTGMKEVSEAGGAGASLAVTGVVVASPAKGQSIEVHVSEATVLGPVYGGDKGEVGGKNYPMAKKAHTLEFLREKAHLRPRSKVFSSAMRVRHAMAFATHQVRHTCIVLEPTKPVLTLASCLLRSCTLIYTVLQQAGLRVRAHAADHGRGLRGRGRAVRGEHAASRARQGGRHPGQQEGAHRLHQGLLRYGFTCVCGLWA